MADTIAAVTVEELETCPVCEARLVEHEPPTIHDWESWTFKCGAQVFYYDIASKFVAEHPCKNSLVSALDRINKSRPPDTGAK